ncbi:glutamine-hydrolyzing GMP synthase [Candidatus Izemoplasma sp. B36]|uniref:glutamine-hydrolyzing GMP synthase n=1 Tax=Candidatus Izemoplasma sp. B36 TaxID=3242468 RepID=UPI0035590644
MDSILIIDYGSQYNQLISRRIREMNVYTEIIPYDKKIPKFNHEIKGIILSGGPNSVYDEYAPYLREEILKLNVPILGICYGMQLLMQEENGVVSPSNKREYGKSKIKIIKNSKLTENIREETIVWMSHSDHVEEIPFGYDIVAKTDSSIAIVENTTKNIYAVQFHPEVTHTEEGMKLLSNFVLNICNAKPNWDLSDFIEKSVENIKQMVQEDEVILGLSGGVDSSVAAGLIYKAIKDKLTCIFVDTGLLRYQEAEEVMTGYKNMPQLKIVKIDAKERFFKALKGITDPEQKRKIIGKEFFEVFEAAKQKYANAKFLAQGTIYPDVIESKSVHGPSATIKSHHNVGGIPNNHSFEILEPLKYLFKDEVRKVGIKLGISKDLIYRHPFPGPGLGIRVIGEVTEEKVEILQKADAIFIEELRKQNLYNQVSQAFVTLLPVKTVGVMGDQRTYEYLCAIRSVNTTDFMTAHISRLPYEFLEKISTRIINEVKGINRLVYDITSKPPGTIEWE